MATVNVSTYIDADVDIELDDLDEGELAAHLREKGYEVSGDAMLTDPDVRSYEYRIWAALRAARIDEVRELCVEMVRERIGRFV